MYAGQLYFLPADPDVGSFSCQGSVPGGRREGCGGNTGGGGGGVTGVMEEEEEEEEEEDRRPETA